MWFSSIYEQAIIVNSDRSLVSKKGQNIGFEGSKTTSIRRAEEKHPMNSRRYQERNTNKRTQTSSSRITRLRGKRSSLTISLEEHFWRERSVFPRISFSL